MSKVVGIDKAGRVVIPVQIRNSLNVDENTIFKVFISNGDVILSPFPSEKELGRHSNIIYHDEEGDDYEDN